MSHVALALLAVLPLLSGGAANLRHARFVHTSRDRKAAAHVKTHGAHRVDGRQGGAHFKKSRKASIETPEAIEAILRSFSVQARELGNKLGMKHEMETERLAAAMNATSDNPTSIALSASMTTNDNNFKDAHKITSSIQRYAKDFTMVLEATNEGGATCKDINCGVHAACTNTMLGAQCVCNEGYIGDGRKPGGIGLARRVACGRWEDDDWRRRGHWRHRVGRTGEIHLERQGLRPSSGRDANGQLLRSGLA